MQGLAQWNPSQLQLQPGQGGGFANAMVGALNSAPKYYQQMVQNQYMAPMLRQVLEQQQQKTQQMQAETPFAAQMAQNKSISAFPTAQLAYLLQSDPELLKDPGLLNLIRGSIVTQLSGGVKPGQNATPFGYRPTVPVGFDVTNPTTSTGETTPPSQQQTMVGNTGRDIAQGYQWLKSKLGGNTPPVAGNTNTTGSPVPSQATLDNNANNYPWMNANIPPEQKAQRIAQVAQKEYDAEKGYGSFAKLPKSKQSQLTHNAYLGIKNAIKNPYGGQSE
jgi:hypothetical protein